MSKLKERRQAVGMSQSELAKASGISKRTIQSYEQGARNIGKAPFVRIALLAKILECSEGDLIDGEN